MYIIALRIPLIFHAFLYALLGGLLEVNNKEN